MNFLSPTFRLAFLLFFCTTCIGEDAIQQNKLSFGDKGVVESKQSVKFHRQFTDLEHKAKIGDNTTDIAVQHPELAFATYSNNALLFDKPASGSNTTRMPTALAERETSKSCPLLTFLLKNEDPAVNDFAAKEESKEQIESDFQCEARKVVSWETQEKTLLRMQTSDKSQLIQGTNDKVLDEDDMSEEGYCKVPDKAETPENRLISHTKIFLKSALFEGLGFVKARYEQVSSTLSELNLVKKMYKTVPNFKELLKQVYDILKLLKSATTEAGLVKMYTAIQNLAKTASAKLSKAFSLLLEWAKKKALKSGGQYSFSFRGFTIKIIDSKKSLSISASQSHLALLLIKNGSVKMAPIKLGNGTSIILEYGGGQVGIKLVHKYTKESASISSDNESNNFHEDDDSDDADDSQKEDD